MMFTPTTQNELNTLLTQHIRKYKGKSVISGLSLRGRDLGCKNLSLYHFRDCSFDKTSCYNTDFSNTIMWGCTFVEACLNTTNFCNANLRSCDFSLSQITGARFHEAKIYDTDFDVSKMNFVRFNNAKLSKTYLSGMHRGCNLSGSSGLLSPIAFMKKYFKRDDTGFIVYKGFGYTQYPPNPNWEIKPGAYIEEVVNPSRHDDCGCGINFATKKWVEEHYPNSTIWECHIDFVDACGILVPYATDGKARCERLRLVKPL